MGLAVPVCCWHSWCRQAHFKREKGILAGVKVRQFHWIRNQALKFPHFRSGWCPCWLPFTKQTWENLQHTFGAYKWFLSHKRLDLEASRRGRVHVNEAYNEGIDLRRGQLLSMTASASTRGVKAFLASETCFLEEGWRCPLPVGMEALFALFAWCTTILTT